MLTTDNGPGKRIAVSATANESIPVDERFENNNEINVPVLQDGFGNALNYIVGDVREELN